MPCPLLLLCFLFSNDSRRLEVGSLSLCALMCLYAEQSRQSSLRAEEADSVIIVPMVNHWFPPPPHLHRKLECVTGWSGG